jgi:hypothetical protein
MSSPDGYVFGKRNEDGGIPHIFEAARASFK